MDSAAEERFVQWATSRSPSLHRFALLLCGDRHTAEDLVQESLARAAAHWHRVEAADHPDAYVRRIVVNQLHSLRRRRSWWPAGRQPDLDVTVGDGADEHASRDQLMSALRRLPPRQRAAVVLRYFEELSEAETAAALGCSIGTVKSQTHKALQSLRRSLTLEELQC